MSLSKVLNAVSEQDVREINRIASKKSIQKISKAMLEDLDRDMLARMISAYMVLKANGHPDNDMVKYLTTKETKKTLKLGFGAAGAVLPSLLTDSEFRALVSRTRKQMKRQKEEKEEEQRRTQQELEDKPKNVAKIGPVTVTVAPDALSVEKEAPASE
jgi:hypothetical protein